MPSSVSVSFAEQELLKIILEFLENRKFHISQLSLERETGIINGDFSQDVLFLRQLILDGQWDSAVEFVEPLRELPEFDIRSFQYYVMKYKYYELLCIKQEPGLLHDNDFAVEDIVECLKQLEDICPSSEDFRRLCALLTLKKLSDHEDLKNWNPSNARIECFYKILPLVSDFLGDSRESTDVSSANERLIQLVIKGVLYEAAVDYCQNQALDGKNVSAPQHKFTKVILPKPRVSSADLSLISWLEVLGSDQFTIPFQQKTLEYKLDALRKPKLQAQWAEQILAAPIQPKGQFPHSLVPRTKLKCAEKMTQSMFLPSMLSTSLCIEPNHCQKKSMELMSKSTTAGFSINIKQPDNESMMKQSQLITSMLLENGSESVLNKNPTKGVSFSNSSEVSVSSIPASLNSRHSTDSGCADDASSTLSHSRRELDAICRRNQVVAPSAVFRHSSLPPVPELGTPSSPSGGRNFAEDVNESSNLMSTSRLFQEFANKNQRCVIDNNKSIKRENPMFKAPLNEQQPIQLTNPPLFNQPFVEQLAAVNHMSQVGPTNLMNASSPFPIQSYLQKQHLQYPANYPMQQQLQQHPAQQLVNTTTLSNGRPASLVFDTATGNLSQQIFQAANVGQHQPTAVFPARPKSFTGPIGGGPTMAADGTGHPNGIAHHHQQFRGGGGVNLPHHDFVQNPLSDGAGQVHLPNNLPESTAQQQGGPYSSSGGKENWPVQFVPLCRYEDSQAIRAVSFHPSGKFFAIGTNSKQLLICKYPDPRKVNANLVKNDAVPPKPEILLSRPKQHHGSVYCCGFNTSGELLATGSNDKTLRLMSFNADECKIGAEIDLTMHDGTVRELIFMEDASSHASVLVSGGAGNCHICLTDCHSGSTFKSFIGHTAPILGLYSWGSGTSFTSCSQDKTIRFWDLRASSAVNVIAPNAKTSNSPVTSVCVDPSGKLLISGHEDASVMLYDIIGGRVVQTYRPHGDEVRTVRCSNAAYYLLSGSYDKRVVITDIRGDLSTPLMYLPVVEHNDKVIQCRWHPHDFTFISTSADRTASLWSLPQRS